jgi:hypothetical protein
MSGSQINLNDALPSRATLKIDPEESPVEHAARVRAESRSKLIEDCMRVTVFTVTLLCLLFVGGLAAYEGFLDPNASAEAKHWGPTVLTSLFTGSVTFLLGRAVGRASGR